MAFTYSITVDIGAAVIAFVVLRTVAGKVREVSPLLWIVAALFVAYFALNPIQHLHNGSEDYRLYDWAWIAPDPSQHVPATSITQR